MPQKITTPHAPTNSVIRHSENGDGFTEWGYETSHAWDDVTQTPAYFRLNTDLTIHHKGGLCRGDRIRLNCSTLSATPTFGEVPS